MEIKKIFDGMYEVTSDGNVYSLKRGRRLLSGEINSYGYRRVTIYHSGKSFKEYVHRIVAKEWLENPYNLQTVNHINGNKLDNRPCNLEWLSCMNNVNHAIQNGLHNSAKINIDIARKIRKEIGPQKVIAKKYGISVPTVSEIRSGKIWKEENW